MTKRTRQDYSAAFKAKVALAAVKGKKTLAELALNHDVCSMRIAVCMILVAVTGFSIRPTLAQIPGG